MSRIWNFYITLSGTSQLGSIPSMGAANTVIRTAKRVILHWFLLTFSLSSWNGPQFKNARIYPIYLTAFAPIRANLLFYNTWCDASARRLLPWWHMQIVSAALFRIENCFTERHDVKPPAQLKWIADEINDVTVDTLASNFEMDISISIYKSDISERCKLPVKWLGCSRLWMNVCFII